MKPNLNERRSRRTLISSARLLALGATFGFLNIGSAAVLPTAPLAEVSARIVLHDAPPPPRHEMRGSRPSRDHVWVNGYWGYRDGRREWVSGHWVVPPHGRHWVEPRWERRGHDYVYVDGSWR